MLLVQKPKLLAPYAIAMVGMLSIYSVSQMLPGAFKWQMIVHKSSWCHKLSLKTATNIIDSFDSAADNARTWFICIVITSLLVAVFVSPRAAAILCLPWIFLRLLTPFGMLTTNPIPQTVLMAFSVGVPANAMSFALLNAATGDLLPAFIYPPFMSLEFVKSL